MKKIFKLVANGVCVMVDSYVTPREYVRPSKQGFYHDNMNLGRDVRKIGNDMRKSIEKKRVERPYQTARN